MMDTTVATARTGISTPSTITSSPIVGDGETGTAVGEQ